MSNFRNILVTAILVCCPLLLVFIQVLCMNTLYYPRTNTVVIDKPGMAQVNWQEVLPEKDVEGTLRAALRQKSKAVRSRWSNDSIKRVSEIMHKHGYTTLGVDHYTALAIISHESGFDIDQVTPNYDTDGSVSSYDYFLTQQNSLVVRDRYYNLKSYLVNRESDQQLRDTLLKRMSGKYTVDKIHDPVVNVALMFQTFRECKQLLKKKSQSLSRMVLCYNSPAYAGRVKKKIEKTAYVKAVMQKRRQIVNLI